MSEAQEWIAEVLMCGPEALTSEQMPLNEIEGWDSLTHLSLILALERNRNEKLTADQIRGIVTIRDVAQFLNHGAPGA
jgi:acyl carrier protein